MGKKIIVILLIVISTAFSAKRDYLIITPEKYVDNLTEFVKFRELSYNVELVTTDRCGKTMKSIREWLQDSLPVLPRYMLLVGHVDDIESDTKNDYADGNYGLYSDPNYPDIFVGRFPVRNNQQLQNIIDKTIYMESNRKSLKKHFEMAGDVKSIYTDYYYLQTVTSFKKLPGSWTHNYTIYRTNDTISRKGFIDSVFYQKKPYVYVYKGHGGNEWQSFSALKWKLDYASVDTMTNRVTPISIGFCCSSNDINNQNSFGEHFVNSKGGAVTYFASSQPIPSKLSGELGELFPKVFFSKDNVDKTVGEGIADLLQKKNMYSQNSTIYYNLLGDPGLRLFNADDLQTSIDDIKSVVAKQEIATYSKARQGIQFNFAESKELKIEVYNLKGERMDVLPTRKYPSGEHFVSLKSITSKLNPGFYICHITGRDISISTKIHFF